jgi:RNA recognition motif-containing protein
LFEKYGVVTECDIMNRCGFVHMQSQEMADNAIKNLNNSLFNGVNIVVERGRMKERKPNQGGPGGPGPQGGPGRMNNGGGPGGPNRNGGNRNDGQNRQGPGGMGGNRGPNQMGGAGGGGNGNGGFRGRNENS